MPRALSQLPSPEFKIYAEREENGVIWEDIKAPGVGKATGKQSVPVFACARASLC